MCYFISIFFFGDQARVFPIIRLKNGLRNNKSEPVYASNCYAYKKKET